MLKMSSLPKSSNFVLWVLLVGMLCTENPIESNIALAHHLSHDATLYPSWTTLKVGISIFPYVIYIILSLIAVTPISYLVLLVATYALCVQLTAEVPPWVPLLLILLSNDIELNPGPNYHENFLSFMNWNLNSLAKNNFERAQLIEAHNSLHNYDLISLCETSLNDSVEIPDPLLNDYTYIPANHPDDVSHGGVGLLYKNTLPLQNRPNLAFEESIVVELKFGRKKVVSQSSIYHHL